MFYTKIQLGEGAEVIAEITEENVFTRCHHCGSELSVDLAEVFADGEGDLYSTAVVCEACSRKLYSAVAKEES